MMFPYLGSDTGSSGLQLYSQPLPLRARLLNPEQPLQTSLQQGFQPHIVLRQPRGEIKYPESKSLVPATENTLIGMPTHDHPEPFQSVVMEDVVTEASKPQNPSASEWSTHFHTSGPIAVLHVRFPIDPNAGLCKMLLQSADQVYREIDKVVLISGIALGLDILPRDRFLTREKDIIYFTGNRLQQSLLITGSREILLLEYEVSRVEDEGSD
jgi:hypothetical protein